MKKLIFVTAAFSYLALGALAQAALLNCEYSMAGAQLGTVKLTVDENGQPSQYADVSLFFAPTRQMPVTNEVPEAGEFLRLYLSKDDSANELLMRVKMPQGEVMKSVLFNAAAPAGAKELQGICRAQ